MNNKKKSAKREWKSTNFIWLQKKIYPENVRLRLYNTIPTSLYFFSFISLSKTLYDESRYQILPYMKSCYLETFRDSLLYRKYSYIGKFCDLSTFRNALAPQIFATSGRQKQPQFLAQYEPRCYFGKSMLLQMLVLELRQCKNGPASVKKLLLLKLPHFFFTYMVRGKGGNFKTTIF